MNDETDRLDRLESGLRKTQDSILLMGKDIHVLTQTMQSIADSMNTLVEIGNKQSVMEERGDSRNSALKEADKVLHRRIDEIAIRANNLEIKCEGNTDELLRRKNLEDRFIIVEEKIESLDLAIILFKHPKVLFATALGFYILAIKDIRDHIFKSLGIM